jgi:hypothetical protein
MHNSKKIGQLQYTNLLQYQCRSTYGIFYLGNQNTVISPCLPSQILEHFLHAHNMPHSALRQKFKTCTTSLNDDKLAHSFMFGVFGGGFCTMSVQKLVILTGLISFYYQYGS